MQNMRESMRSSTFERILVGILSIVTGLVLIYLASEGPLFLNNIKYKTAAVINNQLVGQDMVNMFLLSIISIAGGITLLLRRNIAKYLLIATPLYLIYYALSYTIGWEWSSPVYTGNSHLYTFYFLYILIASLITLMYTLSVFPKQGKSSFKRAGLIVYSVLFVLFLLVFASMWIKEVVDVMRTGTTRAYDIAPTAFWMIRIFDLGFSIPLGMISVYLLWTRPESAYAVQLLFYGFFLTMIVAVNAMGIVMLVNHDPTFLWRDLSVFLALAVIIIIGFVYVLKNYQPDMYAGK
ncbi:MAG: hypothetical protein A2314_03225 [Elusimicrobia bacterium RIFOXYB2_FULL_50_12]|nr:MAG: hypothetical protein A2314_03225 [Elusimicrobia bacterium RIFOXYB2_FULL_50_12]